MKNLSLLFLTLFLTTPSAYAKEVVKLSKSGICHDETSRSYSRTKNFTAYPTLELCLEAGGRAPKGHVTQHVAYPNSDYDRDAFGYGWSDDDRDCQDTRAETLITHNVGILQLDSKQCRVVSGQWNSLFTGDKIYNASEIDIDHIIALKKAWELGAHEWSKEKRERFANDPANLIAVEASLNRQKGMRDITEWLPPANRCQYILRNFRILKKYDFNLSTKQWQHYEEIKQHHCTNAVQ